MTYERLGLDGLQWPCPDPDHLGTPYVHEGQFTRGKGKFHAVDYRDPAEMPDEQYPYFLTTGRMFAHFHTGTMTRISPHLDVEQKTGYVTIMEVKMKIYRKTCEIRFYRNYCDSRSQSL